MTEPTKLTELCRNFCTEYARHIKQRLIAPQRIEEWHKKSSISEFQKTPPELIRHWQRNKWLATSTQSRQYMLQSRQYRYITFKRFSRTQNAHNYRDTHAHRIASTVASR